MLAGARPGARGCPKGFLRPQVRGEGAPAAFIFSSMHLLTSSARLSRFSCALLFSVRIQHSRAAREWVIGSEFATGRCLMSAALLRSGLIEVTALGASSAVGPLPSVSQPASVSAQAVNRTKRPAGEIAELYEHRLHLSLSEHRISNDGRLGGGALFA